MEELHGSTERVVVGDGNRSTARRLLTSKAGYIFGVAALAVIAVIIVLHFGNNGPTKQPTSKNPVVVAYQQKLPSLEKAVKAKPNDATARIAYAQALYVTGDKSAAETQYKEAAKLDPKNPTTQNNLGNTYRDLGAYSEAQAAYSQAIKLQPTNQNAYVNLANLQIYTLHKPVDGIATYKEAINKIGASPQFELLLGLAYEQNGQSDKAEATYKSILASDPGNQAAKDNLDRLQR